MLRAGLGSRSMAVLAEAVRTSALRTLTIRDNRIEGEGATPLREVVRLRPRDGQNPEREYSSKAIPVYGALSERTCSGT